MSERLHVYPINDVVDHDCSHFDECVCGSDVEYLDGGATLITHHALDGREHTEPDHDRTACHLCAGAS